MVAKLHTAAEVETCGLTWTQSHQVHPTMLTIIQQLCSIKRKHTKYTLINANKSTDNEISPVWQNPILMKPRERAGSSTYKDHEPHKLRVSAFSALASDDVPLLRSANNDLRSHYLLLVQLVIARQLVHLNAVRAQTLHNTLNYHTRDPVHQQCASDNYSPFQWWKNWLHAW